MPAVVWDDTGAKVFQTGVDRGMLYVSPFAGVAWNGLVSVSESPSGGSASEFFIDGEKYMGFSALEEFAATIESFGSPLEFAPCAGYLQLSPGLFATNQLRGPFGFSYRTLIGDDVLSTARGYKIHMVYNALAKTSDFSRDSTTESPNVKTRTWDITTTPVAVDDFKPTSHFVVDSTKIDSWVLSTLEDILYGTVSVDPRMLTAEELVTLAGQ